MWCNYCLVKIITKMHTTTSLRMKVPVHCRQIRFTLTRQYITGASISSTGAVKLTVILMRQHRINSLVVLYKKQDHAYQEYHPGNELLQHCVDVVLGADCGTQFLRSLLVAYVT